MKNLASPRLLTTSLLAATGLLLGCATSRAALYHITIDISALGLPPTSSLGPFALDFQLNSGNTLNNNTAVVSNFTFGGGGAPFGAANTFGGASGDLAGGTLTLNDTTPFNEFYQTFTTGVSVGFDLSLTQNVDAGLTPDAFSVSILDGTTANIPTTAGDNTLLHADINTTGALSIDQLNLASGTGTYSGVSIQAVPEPSAAMCALLAGAAGVLRRRRV